MKTEKLFVVDGNFYWHRIFRTQPASAASFPAHAQASLLSSRFLGMVCKDALAVRARRVVVVFDGADVFRYSIFPDYKASRGEFKKGMTNDSDSVYEHLNALLTFLADKGIPVLQMPQYEADDVLASYAHQFENVVLGSRDKDAYQTLREGVSLYDSAFKVNNLPAPRTILHTQVEKLFGVPPSLCVDLQTLTGDKIDNVPTLVTRAKAIKGLLAHGGLKQWLLNDEGFRKSIERSALQLNRRLVKLVHDLPVAVFPIKWNTLNMPQAYANLHHFCNPKSKGLF